VLLDGESVGQVKWGLVGEHNMHNGLMAIAAARHVGLRQPMLLMRWARS
jgi:UDP-N-acetylmuramate: L-alanyl-gamma-D-glutamyl-meso-diaminopimelate ligase